MWICFTTRSAAILFLLAFALPVLFGWWQRRKSRLPVAPFVDEDARCPSCGHRNGALRFDALIRQIVHTCAVCQANWGEKTVFDTDGWLKP